jgi:hypothetical protein
MSTVDCIIGLFIRVDEMLHHAPKHPQARLYPSEVVTLGLLFAPMQIGNKGLSNIVGAKLACLINQYGFVVAWEYGGAGRADKSSPELISDFKDQTVVFVDSSFHSKAGDPPNQKVCERGTNNERMLVEQVFSLLTRVLHLKKVSHRSWDGLRTRLTYVLALLNTLLAWDGFPVDDDGNMTVSIANFVI